MIKDLVSNYNDTGEVRGSDDEFSVNVLKNYFEDAKDSTEDYGLTKNEIAFALENLSKIYDAIKADHA